MTTPSRGGASAADQAAAKRRASAAAKAASAAGHKRRSGQPSATALGKEAKAWNAGAVGEARAARQLARLRGEATVLNDRLLDPAKNWNLDHVVINPAGVFFIDAKNWRGDLSVYKGHLHRFWNAGPKSGRQHERMDREVNKVAAMTALASRRLGYPVTAVIALAGGRSRQFDGVHNVGGVLVLSIDTLAPWLRGLAANHRRLSDAELPLLADLAAKTFPPATLPTTTGWAHLMSTRDNPPHQVEPNA